MFSLDNFYYILYKNLLEPINLRDTFYYPFGSVDPENLRTGVYSSMTSRKNNRVFFYDQEPLFESFYNQAMVSPSSPINGPCQMPILANSEHSEFKNKICKDDEWYDWYYFFHGFAALSWYNDFQFTTLNDKSLSKVFISLNRLTTKDRSYRLHHVADLIDQDLLQHGLVSLDLGSDGMSWKQEVFDPYSWLNRDSRKLIVNTIGHSCKSLVVDFNSPQGWRSAEIPTELLQKAMWNVVTETVFYHKKLHLTEKTFKPIVSKNPFILMAAPGNLAYLKSYGFETFSQWVDESYDLEPDASKRVSMVTAELKKLCELGIDALKDMYHDMLPALNHNHDHFFNTFREKITHELVDNFEHCIIRHNNGRFGDSLIPSNKIQFAEIKKRLLR